MSEVYQDEDFCGLCASEQKRNEESPILLVTLPERTSAMDLEVRVCPRCDGGAAELGTR